LPVITIHSDRFCELAAQFRLRENIAFSTQAYDESSMSNMLAVLLNGIAQLEYDRNKPLPPHQAAYLDRMDTKMDAGILAGDTTIENPDINQRAQFIAANLHGAMKSNDEEMSAALCTWLANRLPDLKQVKIDENGDRVSIDLVFDEEYGKQTAVSFNKLN
jgi:hypothetical protein